jgi:hypothetical protein
MATYYLYIKTHRVTGLKYLGQTCQDPHRYRGSGTRWREHLAKHGFDIDTMILLQTTDKKERNDAGRYYSRFYNVIGAMDDYGNKIWANVIPETGGGSFSGEWNPNKGKKGPDHPAYGRVDTDETNAKRSTAKLGDKNPMKRLSVATQVGVTRKSLEISKGSNNPNHDSQTHIFEHTPSGKRYVMTRFEFKNLGLVYKTGIDRIVSGVLKQYKGWRVVR